MLGISDIRKGKMITLEGEPYLIVSAEFLRKQQRRPVVRSILKHLRTGQTREHSFQQADRVPEADVERRQYQYLYATGDRYAFMDQGTYEQIELPAADISDVVPYLLEGQTVEILLFEGQPVSVDLPIKIDRLVIEAQDAIRGDTSTNVTKEVVIEGGATVRAPLFIKAGDKIRIDTRNGEYLERA